MQINDKTHHRKRIAASGLCLLALLCWLWTGIDNATAHALLVRSLPEANAEFTTSPAQIEFWFSEPLESAFSHAYLVDAAGNELAHDSTTVDAADAMHMTLVLPELAPGIYTVVYRTLSQADGHEWLGSFPLTLLNADGTRPAGAENRVSPAAADTKDALPTALETFNRWLSLMGALLVFGALCFRQIAALPLFTLPLPKADSAGVMTETPPPAFGQAIQRCLQLGLFTGSAALLIGSWFQLAALSWTLSGGTLFNLMLGTRAGNLLLARQLLTVFLLLMALLIGRRQTSNASQQPPKLPRNGVASLPFASSIFATVQFLLGLAILATFSIGSHAAAVAGRNWAILGDFVHLVAAAIWMGGLVLLAVLLWQMRKSASALDGDALSQTVRRFSTTAMFAVFVLICSGLFSSLVQLPALNLLWNSIYGYVLLAKVGVVLLALGIAFFNQRLVRGVDAVRWMPHNNARFLRQVWAESLSGLVMMVIVAVLVQTPVPLPIAAVDNPPYFETIQPADDLTVHLQISPNHVGDNRYVVHLYHEDNSPIGEVQLVRLSFVHQTAELGQANLDLADEGGGLFAAAGAYQNRAGPWDVSVYVRRRGMDDILTTTTVEVPGDDMSAPAPVIDPWQNPIRAVNPGLLPTGIVVAVVLCQLLWVRKRQREESA